jgi:hypothetical protein
MANTIKIRSLSLSLVQDSSGFTAPVFFGLTRMPMLISEQCEGAGSCAVEAPTEPKPAAKKAVRPHRLNTVGVRDLLMKEIEKRRSIGSAMTYVLATLEREYRQAPNFEQLMDTVYETHVEVFAAKFAEEIAVCGDIRSTTIDVLRVLRQKYREAPNFEKLVDAVECQLALIYFEDKSRGMSMEEAEYFAAACITEAKEAVIAAMSAEAKPEPKVEAAGPTGCTDEEAEAVVEGTVEKTVLTKEQASSFLAAVTGAMSDAARIHEEALTRREMAKRGRACRKLADLQAEKVHASLAKDPALAEPFTSEKRTLVERALAKAKGAEAEARTEMESHRGDKDAFHAAIEAHTAAKARRIRIQHLLDADTRLRKEEAKKALLAEKAKRPEPAKAKDEKNADKGRDRERHQRPERESRATA